MCLNDVWEEVKKFYKDKFNIEPDLVNLMSNLEILVLCVNGFSNSSISEFLGIDEQIVSSAIKEYFNFDGFLEDLEFSPLYRYRKGDNLPENIKELCEIYTMLLKVLDERWI